jgi:zinc D-Ala-D-Ala carboxypeptidase
MGKWNYFTDEEVDGIEIEVVAKLDAARHKAGIPFKITSAKRTVEQNTSAGGVPDSAHIKGLAADLHVENSHNLFLMVSTLLEVGFKRLVIGIKVDPMTAKIVYHNLHCDLDSSLPTPVLAVKRYT